MGNIITIYQRRHVSALSPNRKNQTSESLDGGPIGDTFWEKKRLSLFQKAAIPISRGGTSHFPLHAGIFSDYNFHKSCACCHNCYKFMCAVALLCLENTVPLESGTASVSYILFSILPQLPVSLGKRELLTVS